jgi:exopolyphosphatase / guanosine-5'-triphosphate,3'-diphosphate pyrophosphatase
MRTALLDHRPGKERDRATKVAVIDIGSHSIHMLVAKVGNGEFKVLDRVKARVGLAYGTLTDGRLSAKAVDLAIDTLAAFQDRAEELGVHEILAVATSAVREAPNAAEFVTRARRELGLRIDVISGDEEARLVFEAVRNALDFRGHRPLVVDIGGGSIEVIQGAGDTIQWRTSLRLGVVRMADRFIESDPPRIDEIEALRAHARNLLKPVFAIARQSQPTVMVGTSGTFRNLTAMAEVERTGEVPRKVHGRVLRRKDLAALRATLVKLSAKRRERIPGLDRRRVHTIVAGAVLAEMLMDGFGQPALQVSGWALREGIILDFIAREAERRARERRRAARGIGGDLRAPTLARAFAAI